MELSLKNELKTKLVMSGQMKEALNILQMPLADLTEIIAKELDENPLIEATYDFNSEAGSAKYDGFNNREKKDFINYIQKKLTLKDYLKEQACYLRKPAFLLRVIYYIIENIDSRGYFPLSDSQLAEELGIATAAASEAVKIVQDFSPDGIGARSMEECLIIQLKKRNKPYSEKLYEMVENYLPLIADNKIKETARLLKLKTPEVLKYCQIIKTLEPKPSQGFYSEMENYIIPEAYIDIVEGEITVAINDYILPSLKIADFYKDMKKSSDSTETREYLNDRFNSASNLIKNINQRKKTLLAILKEIVLLQEGYFRCGEEHLKQMTFKDIACRVSMHESTICRAIKDKYIQTPQKVIKIKSLFSAGLAESEVSTTVPKLAIKTLIQNENKKKPLSDMAIKEAIEAQGFCLSRRTVAKYRESMGIPPSSKRKEFSSN